MTQSRKPSRTNRKTTPAPVRDFATRAVHVGEHPDTDTGAVSPAIHPSATFLLPE
jgi:cystathionine beta-lyase/cystathionine gamma-synthase